MQLLCCRRHAVGMPLRPLPCDCHAVAMALPCDCHAGAMLLASTAESINVLDTNLVWKHVYELDLGVIVGPLGVVSGRQKARSNDSRAEVDSLEPPERFDA